MQCKHTSHIFILPFQVQGPIHGVRALLAQARTPDNQICFCPSNALLDICHTYPNHTYISCTSYILDILNVSMYQTIYPPKHAHKTQLVAANQSLPSPSKKCKQVPLWLVQTGRKPDRDRDRDREKMVCIILCLTFTLQLMWELKQ